MFLFIVIITTIWGNTTRKASSPDRKSSRSAQINSKVIILFNANRINLVYTMLLNGCSADW